MATVLICDDELMNRKVASKIIKKEGFKVIEAENGKEALEILKKNDVELILMDLMMPVMDGYEATKIIKEDNRLSHIPLIVISALSDIQAIKKGLVAGANEYITKPFDLTEFTLRIKNAIKMGELQNNKNEKDIIYMLSKVVEYRDKGTSVDTVRVGEMSAFLAKKFLWDDEKVELMRLASPMHDIGKVGIADNILLKSEKLTNEEFELMKKHTEIGHNILSQKETPLLKLAAEIALTHHEKYNGSGYPRGLKEEEIPLSGAIVAVIDFFDALLSERPYKKAFSVQKTICTIQANSGIRFHPAVVEKFMANTQALLEIYTRLSNV